MSTKQNKFNPKIILIAGIPIVLAMVILFFFFSKKEENSSRGGLSSEPIAEVLMPVSDEEQFDITKPDVYDQELSEKKKQEREFLEQENYRESDFFSALSDDKVEDSKNKSLSLDELYEKEVMAGKTQQSTSASTSTSGKKNTTNSQSSVTSSQTVTTPKKTVNQMYDEATSSAPATSANSQSNNTQTTSVANETKSASESNVTASGKRKRSSTQNNDNRENLIRACIHGNQKVINGGSVRMRLLQKFTLGNMSVPENTLFSGTVMFGKSRIHINVNEMYYNNQMHKVYFTIYDIDGLEGLELPPNIKQKMAKEGAKTGVSNIPSSTTGGVVGGLFDAATGVVKSAANSSMAEASVDFKMNYELLIKIK